LYFISIINFYKNLVKLRPREKLKLQLFWNGGSISLLLQDLRIF
jgi:hypothetical protein